MAEWHQAKKEMLLALYRYQVMSPRQLALLLGYERTSIHRVASPLQLQGWIRSLQLPFLKGNSKGYVLNPAGAKAAAYWYGEAEKFTLRTWENMPAQLDHSYGTNEFFIRLMECNLRYSDEGWTEWMGTRDAAERYASFDAKGKKKLLLKPDGVGTYQFTNGERLIIHLEYDTGSESLWRLQEKMWNYGSTLPHVWPQPEKVNVLILTRGAMRVENIMRLWDSLRKGPLANQPCPSVWCACEEYFYNQENDCLWLGEAEQFATWRQMPRMLALQQKRPLFLGKQQRADMFGRSKSKME